MLNRFLSGISQLPVIVGKIPFIFMLLLIELYFFINGNAHFPEWDSSYGKTMMAYLIMTIVFLFFSKTKTKKEIKAPLNVSITSFAVAFIIASIIIMIITEAGFIAVVALPVGLFWQTIIMQATVVAPAEELMFRGVLLDWFEGRKWSGVIITSALFALWHSYAYQMLWYEQSWSTINYSSLFIAFLFGVLLALVVRNRVGTERIGGIPAAIGIHAAYNLGVMGVFSLL